jgi:hypothetical protein
VARRTRLLFPSTTPHLFSLLSIPIRRLRAPAHSL